MTSRLIVKQNFVKARKGQSGQSAILDRTAGVRAKDYPMRRQVYIEYARGRGSEPRKVAIAWAVARCTTGEPGLDRGAPLDGKRGERQPTGSTPCRGPPESCPFAKGDRALT
jgi:hypothetical protein